VGPSYGGDIRGGGGKKDERGAERIRTWKKQNSKEGNSTTTINKRRQTKKDVPKCVNWSTRRGWCKGKGEMKSSLRINRWCGQRWVKKREGKEDNTEVKKGSLYK